MFKRVMGDVTFGQVLIKVEDVLYWWLYIGYLDFERMVCIFQTDLNHISVAGENTLLILDGGKRLSDTFGEIAWFREVSEKLWYLSRGFLPAECRTPVLIMWVVDWDGAGNALVFSLCSFCNCCDFQVSLFFSLIGLLDCVFLWWDDKKMRRKMQKKQNKKGGKNAKSKCFECLIWP